MAQQRTSRKTSRTTRYESPSAEQGRVRPSRRIPFYNRTIDKLLILMVPVAWFMYFSWRPVYQLRAEMPSRFVDASTSTPAGERLREQHLARAYWDLARTALRPRYTYGMALPDDPPPDFALDERTHATERAAATNVSVSGNQQRVSRGSRPDSSESRFRYWRKLQQVWLQPDSWESRREWSTAWFTGPFLRLYVNVQDYLSNRFRAI
jgi:hypothetical protein